MKTSILALSTLSQLACAHYFFDSATSGSSSGTQFVRASTRATKYNPIKFSSAPAADIRDNSLADGPDIRCNQGAFTNAGKTDVMEVNAGDDISFKLAVGATMQHPGPGLVYMSKAPSDVKSYDGSGDWFKIFQEGVCNQGDFTTTAWCTWDRDTIVATIPKDTPDGEYLVRVEHIGVHRSHVNQPEHYVSCAQVKVSNGGSGTPGPLVQFPGAYKDTDPYATFSIYNGHKDFPFPGPAVWGGNASQVETGPVDAVDQSSAAPAQTSIAPAVDAAATPTAQPTRPTSPAAPVTGCAAKFQQCGGKRHRGAKCCSEGSCQKRNEWYSQCL